MNGNGDVNGNGDRRGGGRGIRPRGSIAAVLLIGAGAVWVVAEDGSPGWRLLRAAVVIGLTLVLVALLRSERGGTRGAGAVLVLVGSIAAAAGVGIALPHLSKAGLTPVGVAGSALLVGGLASLVLGTAAASRGWRWWGRVLAALIGLVVFAVSTDVVGQAVAATNVPPTELGPATPADRGIEHLDVQLRTADGVTLSGWYLPSRNGAAVVARHGAGSTRSNVLRHAEVLAEHGYGVLLMDARGHGLSGGRAMDFGWYGDEDVAAGVSFLSGRAEVDPGSVAVLGLSMGGEEAIGAAAADARIAAVVAEGVGQRVADDKEWLADEYGWRGRAQVQLERLVYGVTDLLTAADPPTPLRVSVERAAPRPFLLIAGGAEPDEPRVAELLAAASPSAQHWVVPGAGHTGALDADPAEWEQRVIEFLDDALGIGSAS